MEHPHIFYDSFFSLFNLIFGIFLLQINGNGYEPIVSMCVCGVHLGPIQLLFMFMLQMRITSDAHA